MGLNWLIRLYCQIFKPSGWVRLSDGFFIKVRRLELYELDAVKFDDPGPFVYEYIVAGGKTKEAVYDISQWPEPPKPPKIPMDQCQPDSYEAAMWKVYNTYQSALLQRIKQVEAAETYAHDVAKYILAHCVKDSTRLKEPADYELVYHAAINPEVSLSDISQVLSETFGASFDNQPIMDLVLSGKSGSAKVDAIRQWAGQARQAWGLSKDKWAEIGLKERAEMIVTTKLPSWLEALEWRKRDNER